MGNDPRNREGARHGFPQVGSDNNVTTTCSVDDTAQRQALQGQLNALRGATSSSRNTYGGDLITIRDCLNQLGNNSPIANAYANVITLMLGNSSYDNNYAEALTAIDNTQV